MVYLSRLSVNVPTSLALRFTAGGVVLPMFPFSNEVDPTGATSSSVDSSDSPRTLQSYARLALAGVLAWLAWIAFRDELGYVPLLSDIDLAIHEFGHMLFMPFGIQFLGSTMMILGGSLHTGGLSALVLRILHADAGATAGGATCSRLWCASGGPGSTCLASRSTAPTPAPASSCSSTDRQARRRRARLEQPALPAGDCSGTYRMIARWMARSAAARVRCKPRRRSLGGATTAARNNPVWSRDLEPRSLDFPLCRVIADERAPDETRSPGDRREDRAEHHRRIPPGRRTRRPTHATRVPPRAVSGRCRSSTAASAT